MYVCMYVCMFRYVRIKITRENAENANSCSKQQKLLEIRKVVKELPRNL